MRKALFSGIAGAFFFAFTFILNRSMDLSAVTGCGAQACAIFIHCRCFSLFYGKSISGRLFCMKSAKDLPSGFSGVPSGSGFFTPPVSGFYLWRILADCIHLADYHCGRRFADTTVRTKNSAEKSRHVLSDPRRNLHHAGLSLGNIAPWHNCQGSDSHSDCSLLLSAGQPHDNGRLSLTHHCDSENFRHDPVQYALLADLLGSCLQSGRMAERRTKHTVFSCRAVFRRNCDVSVFPCNRYGKKQSQTARHDRSDTVRRGYLYSSGRCPASRGFRSICTEFSRCRSDCPRNDNQ